MLRQQPISLDYQIILYMTVDCQSRKMQIATITALLGWNYFESIAPAYRIKNRGYVVIFVGSTRQYLQSEIYLGIWKTYHKILFRNRGTKVAIFHDFSILHIIDLSRLLKLGKERNGLFYYINLILSAYYGKDKTDRLIKYRKNFGNTLCLCSRLSLYFQNTGGGSA